MTRKYIDDDFMLHFLEKTAKAMEYSNANALELKKNALEKAKSFLTLVSGDLTNKKEIFDLLDGHFETFRKRLEEN